MESGSHPLWPVLVSNRSQYNERLKNIRVHIGDFELKHDLESWIADAYLYAEKTRDVGLTIVNGGGKLQRLGAKGEVVVEQMGTRDILEIFENRRDQVRLYEAKVKSLTGPSVRIPPGGLDAHESEVHDRHTLTQHVFEKVEQLFQRLNSNPRLDIVSSFLSKEVAQEAVGKAIAANETEISRWLSSGSKKKVLYYDLKTKQIGIVLPRGATTAVSSSKVIVRLVRDPSAPKGYWIKTSYVDL